MTTAAYAAYTDACTFFLDENGVCLRVVLTRRSPNSVTLGGRTRADAADRCVGAQYVASIDRRTAGGLVPMPRAGAPLLFAYIGPDGRIAVVRTGPLVRFENLAERETIEPDAYEMEESMTAPLRQSGERGRDPATWAPVGSALIADMDETTLRGSVPGWTDGEPTLPFARIRRSTASSGDPEPVTARAPGRGGPRRGPARR